MTSKKMYLYHSRISTRQSSSIGLLEKKCDLEMTFALFDISSDTCRSPNLEKKQNYILRNIYVSSKGWIILLKTDIKISKQIVYVISNISFPIQFLMNRKRDPISKWQWLWMKNSRYYTIVYVYMSIPECVHQKTLEN